VLVDIYGVETAAARNFMEIWPVRCYERRSTDPPTIYEYADRSYFVAHGGDVCLLHEHSTRTLKK
jgi:hypothetical protein